MFLQPLKFKKHLNFSNLCSCSLLDDIFNMPDCLILMTLHDLLCPLAEKTSQGNTSNETEARKQIEIQSACQWDKDRKKVLEALCRRMNQNRLSQRFFIGPYRIRPVAKIFMRKPSGSLITYRVSL